MKKIILIIVCAFLIGCQPTNDIQDKIFKKEVIKVMKMENKSIDEITHLDLSFLGAGSLEGIEVLENLETLTLSNNILTDLEPISGLTQLKVLDIQNNRISDLSPLKALTKLEVLLIRNNPIESIDVIEHLFKGLKTTDFLVDVTFNDPAFEKLIRSLLDIEVAQLSYFDLLKLRELDISDSDISDLSGIEHALNLETLIINKPVKNLELVSSLKHLKHLQITHSDIESLELLKKMVELKHLDVSYNKIKDISYIELMSQLTYLDVSRNKISDVSALLTLEALTTLYIESNYIADYNILGDLLDQIKETDIFIVYFNDPSLNEVVKKELNKENGVITLDDLKNIKRLDASGQDIYDIGGIELLENLIELNLSHNRLDDLRAIEKLSNIQILKLSDNNISDMTPLIYLTKLTILDISFNQLTSIDALTYLSNLEYLYMKGNDIDENVQKDVIKNQLKGTDDW